MQDKRFSKQDQVLLREILKHRRDIRGNNFLSDPLSAEDIDAITEAAYFSPSVGLSQPWVFTLVENRDIREKVFSHVQQANQLAQKAFDGDKQEGYQRLKLEGILESPVNLVIHYRPNSEPVLGQNSMPEMGAYSVVCAIQNMWLTARARNIGMGWVSILEPQVINKLVGADERDRLVAYLCLGHVKTFPDVPELETLGWSARRPIQIRTI